MSIILFILILLLPGNLWAACGGSGNDLVVSSPYSDSDFEDCVDSASLAAGPTVTITMPSSATWAWPATADMSSGFTNVTKLILTGGSCTLDVTECTNQGQGVCPSDCTTAITGTANAQPGGFNLITKDGKAIEIKNFRFNAYSGLKISGDGKNIRIHHNYFYQAGRVPGDGGSGSHRTIIFHPTSSTDWTKALIDHNYFNQTSYIVIDYNPQDVQGGLQNYLWSLPMGFGTDDAIYVEDNKFGPGFIFVNDSLGGGSMVFRYNDVTIGGATSGFLECHDMSINQVPQSKRACKRVESYNNSIHSAYSINHIHHIRGGNWIIFNNVYDGEVPNWMGNLAIYRTDAGSGGNDDPLCQDSRADHPKACIGDTSDAPYTCSLDSDCHNISGACVYLDGAGTGNYPCRDQLGVKQESDGSQTGGGYPMLGWGNTVNGGYGTGTAVAASYGGSYMTSTVDYCWNRSGTQPTTCNGITVSTYWPGPYTYPHPLQLECPGNYITVSCTEGESGTCRQSCDATRAKVAATVAASSANDGVYIPADTQTWATSQVEITVPLVIKGAGLDQTHIVNNSDAANKCTFVLNSSTGTVRVTGIDFSGSASGLEVAGNAVRIDHNKFTFTGNGRRAIWVDCEWVNGVIDANEFYNTSGLAQGIIFKGCSGTLPGDTSWTNDSKLGTEDMLFVENNKVYFATASDAFIDCDNGGRFVFRYNDIDSGQIAFHGCDSVYHSCREAEIYNNKFTKGQGNPVDGAFIYFRGGPAIVYGNELPTGSSTWFQVTNYRSADCGSLCNSCNGASEPFCDGNAGIDGNTAPTETNHGWPCREQIGRGKNNGSQPLYSWANTVSGTPQDIYIKPRGGTDYTTSHIQADRDLFNCGADKSDCVTNHGLSAEYSMATCPLQFPERGPFMPFRGRIGIPCLLNIGGIPFRLIERIFPILIIETFSSEYNLIISLTTGPSCIL